MSRVSRCVAYASADACRAQLQPLVLLCRRIRDSCAWLGALVVCVLSGACSFAIGLTQPSPHRHWQARLLFLVALAPRRRRRRQQHDRRRCIGADADAGQRHGRERAAPLRRRAGSAAGLDLLCSPTRPPAANAYHSVAHPFGASPPDPVSSKECVLYGMVHRIARHATPGDFRQWLSRFVGTGSAHGVSSMHAGETEEQRR